MPPTPTNKPSSRMTPEKRAEVIELMRKYAESLEPLAKVKEARRLRLEAERINRDSDNEESDS